MGRVTFTLNGSKVEVAEDIAGDVTLLDWLRETKGMTGTKEGCNEGDCGACTVMVTGLEAGKPVARGRNACILFLSQLHGTSVRTVEGLASPDGEPHPVQNAMVGKHGSQCGFCTPGFVMSLAAAHQTRRRDFNTVLAGNLCRCTGYAPIIRAARRSARAKKAPWLAGDATDVKSRQPDVTDAPKGAYVPLDVADLASWYAANPDATLVAGATDVGLWVTKALKRPEQMCFIGNLAGLQTLKSTDDGLWIGAGVSISRLRKFLTPYYADFALMLERFGSSQVRASGTIGGNIANGSPIGDGPPPLIALGATVHLNHAESRRSMPLEDFFIDYGKQDRRPGEFVEAIHIPAQPDRLRVYKLSKRFDQDISALCGAFNLEIDGGKIQAATIAFGGMAATPKRAKTVELSLLGKQWSEDVVRASLPAFAEDYQPIGDMRASASYRLEAARNMLTRYFAESHLGTGLTRVQEVSS